MLPQLFCESQWVNRVRTPLEVLHFYYYGWIADSTREEFRVPGECVQGRGLLSSERSSFAGQTERHFGIIAGNMCDVEFSSQKKLNDLTVTVENLKTISYQDLLKESEYRTIYEHQTRLWQAYSAAYTSGAEGGGDSYFFLWKCCSLAVDEDGNFTNSAKEELTNLKTAHQEVLEQIILLTEICEMKARFLDILFESGAKTWGQNAVTVYLECATLLRLEGSFLWGKRFQRAAEIAWQLDKKSKAKQECKEYARSIPTDTFKSWDLEKYIKISKKFDLVEKVKLRQLAIDEAKRSSSRGDSRAIDWLKLVCELSNSLTKQEDLAELYKAIIKRATQSPTDYFLRAFTLSEDRRDLERLGGSKDQLKEVENLIIQYQRASIPEMPSFEFTVILDPVQAYWNKAWAIESIEKACLYFSEYVTALTIEVLREQIVRNDSDNPTIALQKKVLYDDSDRLEKVIPGSTWGDSQGVDLDQKMWHMTEWNMLQNLLNLEHARQEIAANHPRSAGCFDWLLVGNKLVPEDRKVVFERGILSGLEGDYLVSVHLLIPQIEYSIRSYLEKVGHTMTRFINNSQKQESEPLGRIFKYSEIRDLLGHDLTFFARGFLIESAGMNLRNTMAHGNISSVRFDLIGPALLSFTFALLLKARPDSLTENLDFVSEFR